MNLNNNITKILFATLMLNFLSACQTEEVREEVIRPIKAMKIGSIEQIIGKSFPGIAKATQEVDLSFRVSGTLKKMPIKVGQKVRVGDILAGLDRRDYEVEVANAKAG
ncbi:MAG: biotin/lipoyl-binding protein, partial [Colwellia sp.]|nr:biotin/lipoyl-binding protein [Colwellia sp.]